MRGAGARGGGARREGSAAPRLVRLRPRGLLRRAGGGKMAGAAAGGARPVDPVRLGRCGSRGGRRPGGADLRGSRLQPGGVPGAVPPAGVRVPGVGDEGSLIVNGRLSERTRRNLSFLWEAA